MNYLYVSYLTILVFLFLLFLVISIFRKDLLFFGFSLMNISFAYSLVYSLLLKNQEIYNNYCYIFGIIVIFSSAVLITYSIYKFKDMKIILIFYYIFVFCFFILYVFIKNYFCIFPILFMTILLGTIFTIRSIIISKKENYFSNTILKTKFFIVIIMPISLFTKLFRGVFVISNNTVVLYLWIFLEMMFSLLMAYFLLLLLIYEYKELQSLKLNLEIKVLDRTVKLKEAVSELQTANTKLQTLDKLKNDFIANITHDFRSPLTVILNTSDLFLKSNKKDKNRQDFELMYKSSLKLKDTIDRLLELAKLEAQGVKLNVQEINIVSFLDNIVNYYQAALSRSKIKIIKKNMGTAADDFFNDPEKLEEIINNIISNAIKFVDKETGVIEIELKDYNDAIEIIITDNGIGIPREKLTAIFNRFEQLEGGSKYHGTGIGLAFSMQLAGRMSGQIWAESEGRGKGAKFFIKLKKGVEHFDEKDFTKDENQKTNKTHDNKKELLAFDIQKKLAKEETIVHLDNLQGENEYDYKKAKILIVDDDNAINRITFNYLQNNGYSNFIISNTGNLGLEAVYKYKPDLIICDYNMPDIKGSELHDEIVLTPEFKLIPFIFLSAVADKDLIIERREHGALAYLKKPIDEKDLILTVDLHLKRYFEFRKIGDGD